MDDFDCDYRNGLNVNNSLLHEFCPTKDADPKVFDFGIYLYALQSGVIGSFNLPRRICQSFWWALRNLRLVHIVES